MGKFHGLSDDAVNEMLVGDTIDLSKLVKNFRIPTDTYLNKSVAIGLFASVF